MTLITSFSIDGYPFLLGDLLVSGPEQVHHTLHLPSIGEITEVFPKGSGFVPTRLTRKVCHFGNLAVAWAGQRLAAKVIVSQLFEEMQDRGPISFERLDDFFSSLDPWLREALWEGEVALLGLLVDSQGKSLGFGSNYAELNSSFLDDVRIAGSGMGTFQDYFDHSEKFELGLGVGIRDGSFEASACKALTVTGMLLQLEIGTFENLLNYFGGGYELLSLKENRFVRCSEDLLTAFWFADVTGDEITISPVMKFVKQDYHRDVMIIRTLEMKAPDPKDPLFLTDRIDEVHYFWPLYREPTEQEKSALPKSDLTAFILCSYVLVRSQSGIEVLSRFDFSKKRELPLRFVDDGQKMELQIRKKHLDDIFSHIESRK